MEDSQQTLKALSGHCSAIYNDTLYMLSDSKLLSLPLRQNATVAENTAPPQDVEDPACVRAGDALYVIGGGGTPQDYKGLQKYSFTDSTWETVDLPVDVLQTRRNHSTAYLEDSKEILIYAGSTDAAPSLLSSQTFLLSTVPPYILNSFTSDAPPATRPILQPWNSSHAVMVGGETTNNGIWLFGAADGWSRLGTNLSEPIDPSSRGILIDGTDGSKVLQLFDMSASPNTVENIVLLDAGGKVAPTGMTVGGTSSSLPSSSSTASSSSGSASSRKRKRDLTLGDWPQYNSTNAPTSTRTDCSIAQNSQDLVVMAGGSDDEPIVLFNRSRNSWVDPDDFFGVKEQIPLQPTSTTSTTSGPSRTAEPSSSIITPPSGMSAHDRMLRTLGITLGVLCGIAVIFIFALLFLRWRKLKARRKAGYLAEKNNEHDPNRMSFADRGASFMKEAGMSVDDLAPPNRAWVPGKDHDAHSSLAIITGKFNPSRNANHGQKASFESTTHLVKNKNGQMMPSEKFEMMDIGDKSAGSKLAVPGAAVLKGGALDQDTRAERKRSSGWSKYFATTQPTGPNGVSHIPSVYVKPGNQTQSRRDSECSSDETRSSTGVLAPPLHIDFEKTGDGHRMSQVTTGSPHFFNSQDDFASRGSVDVAEGQRGLIIDPNDPRRSLAATSISSYGNRSTVDSRATSEYYNESGHTPWTPMSATQTGFVAGAQQNHERRTSSVYTANTYDASGRRPSRGKGTGFFPGAGTGYVKPTKTKFISPAASTPPTTAGPATTAAPSGLELPRAPFAAKSGDVRDSTSSTITVFPGGKAFDGDDGDGDNAGGEADKENQKVNGDMSWLKLG